MWERCGESRKIGEKKSTPTKLEDGEILKSKSYGNNSIFYPNNYQR